ncbi:MAG: hypothetical protein FWG10_13625 [Eubacteriaceae bacterium]|nr:hypothetical protein [Eubacteriaceae bacterium]
MLNGQSLDPQGFAPYFGFTEIEVESLCASYNVDIEEMRSWFDGYRLANYDHLSHQNRFRLVHFLLEFN